jgi:hypothetical protein
MIAHRNVSPVEMTKERANESMRTENERSLSMMKPEMMDCIACSTYDNY